jgi:hypothetical protein
MIIVSNMKSAIRPYERLNTYSFDFSIYDELAMVNDHMKYRDPDLFLKQLQEESNIEDMFFKPK